MTTAILIIYLIDNQSEKMCTSYYVIFISYLKICISTYFVFFLMFVKSILNILNQHLEKITLLFLCVNYLSIYFVLENI